MSSNTINTIEITNRSHVEVTIFAAPSGNVRGIVVAMKDSQRVAHAYLFTDKKAQITLDKVRGYSSVFDIREYAAALCGFVDEIVRAG